MLNYSLGLYEKSMPANLSIEEKLIETKRAGFDFMEISIDESEEKLARLKWNREQRAELARAILDTGIKILTLCLSAHRKYPIGSEDGQTRKRGMEIMSDAIDFAADLGIRIIQIAGYDEYYRPSNENTRRFFEDNLKVSTELAARKGVTLAFETMETEFMNTVCKAMKFVSEVRSPFLQVYPDVGNITNAAIQYGKDILEDIEAGRGHLVGIHLKETLPGKFREIPYGTGHVDFKKVIRSVRLIGVNLFVGEFWYLDNDDWRDQLTIANRFLRDQFI